MWRQVHNWDHKPSIAELEKILNSEEAPKISLAPDGSCMVEKPNTVGDIADAVMRLLQEDPFGYIVANANGDKFRCWHQDGPSWTDRKQEAVLFVRRSDAEAVFSEDEDAWRIVPVTAADIA